MMLFKLSIKNITKSIKDYAIYFFTLVLGVAIFYVFNAIDSQTVMLNVSSSTSEIIRLMTTILGGVSVFVSFILGFLIIYASRFLIKRRNKEFGIYLTLGMSKRKISLILFFETLIIGVISLGVGLALGIVLSQLMSILVANMFEADLTKFQFTFSSSAALKTLLYFSIMYLIVMIFNTIIVNKCKLIDLLHGNKKSEKVKLKNPIICTIVFIIAVIALSYAYYLVTDGFGTSPLMNTISGILIPIVLGCISTFLIFWSLSGLILKIVMHLKKYYYKGLNSFTVRQISSKINTTVFSMTIICLMLFFTICIFSSALSIKNSLSGNLKDLAPVDIQFSKLQQLSDEEEESLSKDIIEDYNTTVKDTLQRLDVYKYLKDVVDINIYRLEEITLKDSFGDQIEQIRKDYPLLAYQDKETLIKLSDYNRLAKLYNKKELTLKDNEYVIIANYKMMAGIRNISLKNNTKLTINGKDYYPKYQKCQDGIIELSGSATNTGVIILPDNALEGIHPYKNILAANYQADTKEEKENVEDIVSTIINNHFNKDTLLSYNTKIDIYASSVGLGAMVTFVGLYLGIIFLISSAAILALKELSESTDNKERFNMLRKIGTDEKMINKALFNQIAVFFLFPLLLAIIHSIFGIEFANYILKTMGTESLLSSIILTAVFLVVIYGGYFLVTYYCSKTIIKER
jgi:putative ABC transport system permease protein